MADPKECAAVGALQRPRRTPEDDRFTGNWYNYTNCGKYDHIRAFTVETPRRGVSTEFMIVLQAIDIITKNLPSKSSNNFFTGLTQNLTPAPLRRRGGNSVSPPHSGRGRGVGCFENA